MARIEMMKKYLFIDTDQELADISICHYGIVAPRWTDECFSVSDIDNICHGGCASGAYMPAVTYWQARQMLNSRGDEVLQYIEDECGELPQPPKNVSWGGLMCFYLSCAVELWASNAAQKLSALDAADIDRAIKEFESEQE